MTNAPETNVGGITAKLSIDSAEFDRKAAEAEAKAKDLGALSPNVRVTADVADAIGKLSAVEVAEKRVETAQRQAANSASTAYVASERLKAMREKGTATALQLTAATEASARADRNAESAELRHMAALEGLKRSQDAEAKAALEGAAANDVASRSADSAGKSSKAAAVNMGTLWAAVAAIAPAAVPIAAMAVGLTGSLAGMGAAAVLAFKGAYDEMKLGTTLGLQYKSALNDLQGSMQVLEDTAAGGLIKPFTTAVGSVTSALPQLNQEVGVLSGQLGGILITGLDAVIHGLHIMEPLFVNAGVYVEHLVGAFAGFTNQGGLQQFGNYALSTLPMVSGLLDSLLQTVWHLLDALAPLGIIGVTVLTDISNVINAIPTPMLTALIGAATGGFLAFKAWGIVSPLLLGVGSAIEFVQGRMAAMTVVAGESAAAETVMAETTAVASGVMEAAMGPIGWIIAGIGAVAAGFLASQAATSGASAALDSYTASLQQDNGKIGDHTKQQAAAVYATNDMADAASKLGVTTQQLTDYVTGNGHAQKAVNEKLDEAKAKYENAGISVDEYGRATQLLTPDQQKLKDAYDKVTGSLKTNSDAVKTGIALQRQEAINTGQTVAEIQRHDDALQNISTAYNTANVSQTAYLKALDTFGKSAGTAADKGTFIGATLKASQGDALGYAGALANAANANYQLTQTFDQQGKMAAQGVKFLRDTEFAAIDLNTGLIDVTKSGAPALISQLQAMQDSAVNAASALYQHEQASKGAGQAAKDAAAIFKTDTYDALVGDAQQLGLTTTQAGKLADQYFAMPKDISTQVMTIGEQKVVNTLDQIGSQLSVLTGTPWKSVLTADNQTAKGTQAAAQAIADAAKPVSVTIDANTDSIKPKIVGLSKMIDDAVNAKHQVKVDIATADAKAKVDLMQAEIDSLQQRKAALLKVGTTDALAQAADLQNKIDAITQKKAVALMVNPDPAIASTTSIQERIDQLKQKNAPQVKADPTPAWQVIAQTQDSIDVLHQKHDIPLMVSPDYQGVANFQAEIDQIHGKTVQVTTNYVANGKDTGIPNTTNIPSSPGNVRMQATGGPFGTGALKRAGGGILNAFPGGKIVGSGSTTSDDVPLWGSRDEYVVKASSVASVGVPAMDYINKTGQLPPQPGSGGGGTVVVNLVLDGKVIDSRIIDLSTMTANQAISGANQFAGRRAAR